MASYSARLRVHDQEYPVVLCTFGFTQATSIRGRANERVRHGLLELVLDVPVGDQLPVWAATPHYPLDGHVAFYQESDLLASETVFFTAGQCVNYQEEFEAGAGLIGSYRCSLTIAATQLRLAAGGPPAHLLPAGAPAIAASAAPVAATVAAVATAATTAPHWLASYEAQLGAGAAGPAAVTRWVAGGLSEQKLKSAFRQSPDPQLVYTRLLAAEKEKGLYQQRVVVDDYQAIPGVAAAPHVPNGLPQVSIPASSFGVDDPAFDLPANRADTFAGSAQLVELAPGTKLYRVASDPATDPYGRTGGYWTRTPPASLAGVVGGTAVMPEWNNYQRVYELTVPTPTDGPDPVPKYYAWEGPAAAQPVSGNYPDKIDNGYCLPGGENQLLIPNKLTRSADFGKHITDVSSLHKSW